MTASLPTPYTPATDLLKGRVILVTGASGGLGSATALACAQHGATVILLGRNVAKLESVYDAIEQAGGATPAIYPMNLAGAAWADYSELAGNIERQTGRLDGIVHCAAHFKSFTPVQDIEPRDWVESLQVNLTAAYSLTRHCLPLLRASSDASVVFMSDAAGRAPRAFNGVYGIAKAALEAMSSMWAQELESISHVRINTYNPGPLRTAHRVKGYPGDLIDNAAPVESAIPALLWLLGPDSAGVSGRKL
ncbi:MAG: SDR family NAD(P)-dependent oxidoreductase [Stenotrophobium sp.]